MNFQPSFLDKYGKKLAFIVLGILLIAGRVWLGYAVESSEENSPWTPAFAAFGIWPYVVIALHGVALAVYGLFQRPLVD